MTKPITPIDPRQIHPVHVEALREYYQPEDGSKFGRMLDNLRNVMHERPHARTAMHEAAEAHRLQPPNTSPGYNPDLVDDMLETRERWEMVERWLGQLQRQLVNYLVANGGEPLAADLTAASPEYRQTWRDRETRHRAWVANRYGWEPPARPPIPAP